MTPRRWQRFIGTVNLHTSSDATPGTFYACDAAKLVDGARPYVVCRGEDIETLRELMQRSLRLPTRPTDAQLAAWLYHVAQERARQARSQTFRIQTASAWE